MAAERPCPECGAELVHDTPEGLCPKCLIERALNKTQDVAASDGEKTVLDRETRTPQGLTAPRQGQMLGDYHLIRRLGEGGMGIVYEAAHVPSERRVALKILNHELDSMEARKRFLREGQLAASINHPNAVYIFGTDEIEGLPVITMELASGGTLKDRVKEHGPLPVTEAVDAVVQVIAGLDAAQRQGVLHRDVKPSNCFLDSDGMVKVGDFGLSISTLARGETQLTATGRILGTPAFTSPEQLRGDELDVRSDIYSVGVTLYYLLTGKVPFDETNLVKLVTLVVERAPDSPAKLRSEIPDALAQVILRCLAKQPAKRFSSYDELRHALVPFSSEAPIPAPLMLRFLAGAIDIAILRLGLELWVRLLTAGQGTITVGPPFMGHFIFPWSGFPNNPLSSGLVLVIGYFTLLEGYCGNTIGKAVCGIRVVGPWQTKPGRAALVRAATFLMPWLLWMTSLELLRIAEAPLPLLTFVVLTVALPAFTALLFTTCRRSNGFAGWHDLASGTRVILKAAFSLRVSSLPVTESAKTTQAAAVFGPYRVLAALDQYDSTEMFLGFDDRLRRNVWIRKLAPGTPEVPAQLRNTGRATRLRWLNGKRSLDHNWDAYEAPSGQPLLQLITEPQPWRHVRDWLRDLAEELRVSEVAGSSPAALALDRVWITNDGRAKLLDFPAPGTKQLRSTSPVERKSKAAQLFLKQVAVSALEGVPISDAELPDRLPKTPLPMQARDWLIGVARAPALDDVINGLALLMRQTPEVSRMRRLALNLGCWLPLVIIACILAFLGKLNKNDSPGEHAGPISGAHFTKWENGFGATVTLKDGIDSPAVEDELFELMLLHRTLEAFSEVFRSGFVSPYRRPTEIGHSEPTRELKSSLPKRSREVVGSAITTQATAFESFEKRVAELSQLITASDLELAIAHAGQRLLLVGDGAIVPWPLTKGEREHIRGTVAVHSTVSTGDLARVKDAFERIALLYRPRFGPMLTNDIVKEWIFLAGIKWQLRRLEWETFLAGRFGKLLTKRFSERSNEKWWRADVDLLRRIIAGRTNVNAREFTEAIKVVRPAIVALEMRHEMQIESRSSGRTRRTPMLELPVALAFFLTCMVALPSLLAAVLFHGGLLLHGLGITVAAANGARASRWRVFCRAALTWSPLPLICIGIPLLVFHHVPLTGSLSLAESLLTGAGLLIYFVVSLLSLRDASCGVADRLAGTRVVPK